MSGPPPAPSGAKAELRQAMRERLRQLRPAERGTSSAGLCRHLEAERAWQDAGVILGFAPLATEPDVSGLLRQAHASGRRILLPRFDASAGVYRPVEVLVWDRDLVPGPYGVLEPHAACPAWDGKALDFVLVPGLGFSALGARLGRGKGYYDRLLATLPGLKCGVAFETQMIREIPLEPHDIRVDLICTEAGCRRCGPSS